MGDATEGAHDEGTLPPPSSEPDTEPGAPPTPTLATGASAASVGSGQPTPTERALSSDSLDVPVDLESAGGSARTTLPDASHLATTARSRDTSKQASPTGTGHSSTTLQSMMKPDVSASGVPHTRRFLRIENDLDQTTATVRLLEKHLAGTQKEARIALFVATLAVLIAALAIAR